MLALAAKHRSVAVIGLAKNTGKTVTVNYLIAKAQDRGLTIGISTTGRDGEISDVLSALPKPPVFLQEGSVVATAKSSFRGSARLEILDATGFSNPLGEIVIARVRESGTVEISGPERTQDLKVVIEKLEALADLVIIDGALDRMAASAPSVTQGAILATGAVLGPDILSVVKKTVHAVRLLKLGVAKVLTAEEAQLVYTGKIAVSRGGIKVLPLETAVDGPLAILDYLGPDSRLLLGGALTDELAELLISAARNYGGLEVVVRDGTRVFVGESRWQSLIRCGATVSVVEPINLEAITINPVDPRGRQLPAEELRDALQRLLPDMLIVNPLAEGR